MVDKQQLVSDQGCSNKFRFSPRQLCDYRIFEFAAIKQSFSINFS